MAKEPNLSKAPAKKPPAVAPKGVGEPAAKPPTESAQVKGKVVRKDAPATGGTVPFTDESVDAEKSKKPSKSPPSSAPKPAGAKGKVVRKNPPAGGATQPVAGETVGFESPISSADADALAESILLGDDTPVENGTQAFTGDTIDTEAPAEPAPDETPADPPAENMTQAFAGDTLESDMPKLVLDDPSANVMTQPIVDRTIDTEMAKEPAKRPPAPARKPADPTGAAPAGAQKGATMLAGKYKLLKKLGQGGMGSVYKAHDVNLDRIVAVKVLAKELADKGNYVERFKREARVMIKLDHPNVLRCFDFDKDKEMGLHYLAIEFVEGGSVEGWLKKLGRFPIGDALHIILKAAAGLQHAHDKSLIHRDVKPDNLLLTKEGVIKVADLGLAKDTEEDVSLTKTGAGAGTPIYMAPEQARDVKHVDCRVDIYAMGVMLYVFLTGQPPFQGTTLVELISAKEKGKFDRMRKYNNDVPDKLDLIVDKMIAKDPKNRYASCQEVIDDLEPLGLANEQLSFIETDKAPASPTIAPGPKAAPTSGPAKVAAKTSVGAAGNTPGAKTSGPAAAENTSVAEDEIEKDVWYWQFLTPNGKPVTKKMTSEQVRTLIKSGHLDAEGRLSKTEKSGFRAAGTFTEFQSIFKSLKTATKANARGTKYRDKFKAIDEEDARRRKNSWLSRLFKSFGSTVFGLLWIVLILGLIALAIFGIFKYMN